jgi:NAD(P)-dependent dehydrogenase (short-subunit alcohol dehydrogenase family)
MLPHGKDSFATSLTTDRTKKENDHECHQDGITALVTGANRGIGRAITEALLERGASKVYAAARDTGQLADLEERYAGRVVPLELDVTNGDQVRAVAERARDVRILVNNAGIALGQDMTADTIVDQARQEMEVNYFAPLHLLQRFAPTLTRNGGAVVNISSIAGLTNFPMYPTYSASKAATHSLTQGARMLLGGQGVSMFGVYPGPVDTDMARDVPMEKTSPRDVAESILDSIESGQEDIFPDPFAVQFGQQFQSSPKASEQQIAQMVAPGPA